MNYTYHQKLLSKYKLFRNVVMTFNGVSNTFEAITLQRGDGPLFYLSPEELIAMFDALRSEAPTMEALRRLNDEWQDETRRAQAEAIARKEARKEARKKAKEAKEAAAAQLPGDSLREGAMRVARAAGATYAEIGKEHGLSAQAVFQILCPHTTPPEPTS